MKQKKRRSDIAKLVTRAREVWRQSVVYVTVKRAALTRPGWFRCRKCCDEREVIKIDHVIPIGAQPDNMMEFGPWLEKLFCDDTNLQPLCVDCHKIKGKSDKIILKNA